MTSTETGKKQVRVWVDGCFDMMHWGHANLCRQAKECGDYLLVGVHNDEEVRKNKGPPVMNEQERYLAVESCKWVDEVVRDAPYYTSVEFCKKFNVDYIIHGDDISVGADGTDTYAEAKKAGMFRTVPRTIGVSSTDLVGRMLLVTKGHFVPDETAHESQPHAPIKQMSQGSHPRAPKTVVSNFLPSSRRIVQFSEGRRDPVASDVVVYCDGGFDMFHVGHIAFLREAKKLGTYLIVGICTDQQLNKAKGENYPIMNIHERTLGVLSCRYVDEVIIGAPWSVSEQMIVDLNIKIVCHGTQYEQWQRDQYALDDPYKDAKRLGVYRQVPSPNTLTTSELIDRIMAHRSAFVARNNAKMAKEAKLIEENDAAKKKAAADAAAK